MLRHSVGDESSVTIFKRLRWTATLFLVASSVAWSQVKRVGKEFEVASIRQRSEASGLPSIASQPGGLLIIRGASLRRLVMQAYGLHRFQVTGGPPWSDRGVWDITARAPNTPNRLTDREMQPFLRTLLSDRFSLKVHHESKELRVYSLLVAKGGSKIKENTSEARPRIEYGRGFLNGKGVPINTLANVLSELLDRMVVDKTGLAGRYDVYCEWTPELGIGDIFGAEGTNQSVATLSNKSRSLFTAIKEQLGLRLKSEKGEVEIVVIDQAKEASAN